MNEKKILSDEAARLDREQLESAAIDYIRNLNRMVESLERDLNASKKKLDAMTGLTIDEILQKFEYRRGIESRYAEWTPKEKD